MSKHIDEPLERLPSAIPPANLGSIPLSVYARIMDHLQPARQFVEVASIARSKGEAYEGSLDAACDAAWSAIYTLYKGLQALPRQL
ncbi:MAG: hypothetical protein AAB605_02650 [Patescibacteria group bacterium]|mgnify:FL=1